MDSKLIRRLMVSDDFVCSYFCGVFPVDMLPPVVRYPSALIINTDPHHLPGKHWVALFFDKYKHCDYFDSYGMKPPELIYTYIQTHSTHYTCNTVMLQQLLTTSCGQFCIFFLFWRCRGLPMSDIVNELQKHNPDTLVTYFVNDVFDVKLKSIDRQFIELNK